MKNSDGQVGDTENRLELYKIAVEMADRTSARRAGANSFFFTLHAALAAFVGVVSAARHPLPKADVPTFDPFGLVITAAAGFVLSLTWWVLLRYYRRLNRAKFSVINEMETRLLEQPFTREWTELHPGERRSEETNSGGLSLRRWWRRSGHREASAVEQVVPLVFAGIYLVLAVRAITQ